MRPLSGAASAPRFLGVGPLGKNRGADAQWHSLWGGAEVVRLQKIVKARLNSHEFSYVVQNVNSKFAQSECHWAYAAPLGNLSLCAA